MRRCNTAIPRDVCSRYASLFFSPVDRLIQLYLGSFVSIAGVDSGVLKAARTEENVGER